MLWSGPPCYLFGPDGKLIMWAITGEGGELDQKLRKASKEQSITLEEALETFKPDNQENDHGLH
jgi:hypothetical protein